QTHTHTHTHTHTGHKWILLSGIRRGRMQRGNGGRGSGGGITTVATAISCRMVMDYVYHVAFFCFLRKPLPFPSWPFVVFTCTPSLPRTEPRGFWTTNFDTSMLP